MYIEEKLHFATKSFTFSRSSGKVLPDDHENVKLLVAKCSFSSVYTSYIYRYKVLPDDRENVKLLVAKCSFSSVYTSYIYRYKFNLTCQTLSYVISLRQHPGFYLGFLFRGGGGESRSWKKFLSHTVARKKVLRHSMEVWGHAPLENFENIVFRLKSHF